MRIREVVLLDIENLPLDTEYSIKVHTDKSKPMKCKIQQ